MKNIKFKLRKNNVVKTNHPVKLYNPDHDTYINLEPGYYIFKPLGDMVSRVRKLDPKSSEPIGILDSVFDDMSMETFDELLSNASVAYTGEVQGKIKNKCKIIVKVDTSSSDIKFDTNILNTYTVSCDNENNILLYLDKGINFSYDIATNDLTSLDNQPLDCTKVISSGSIVSLLDGVTKGNNVKKL